MNLVIPYLIIGVIWAGASTVQLLINGVEDGKIAPWYGFVLCFVVNIFIWPVSFIVTMFN